MTNEEVLELFRAEAKRCLLVALTYDEVRHLMFLLGANIGDAENPGDWSCRKCDLSKSIMERFSAAFGKAL